MKTSIFTQAVIAVSVIVIFASCSTSRSYLDSRRYPDRYPTRERVVVIREHPRPYGHYRRDYRRKPVYAHPRYRSTNRYNNNRSYNKRESYRKYDNNNYGKNHAPRQRAKVKRNSRD